jgi:hypothetical protein
MRKRNWKKIFTAAKTGGAKNDFIEQNMDMTKDGAAFLKTLQIKAQLAIGYCQLTFVRTRGLQTCFAA